MPAWKPSEYLHIWVQHVEGGVIFGVIITIISIIVLLASFSSIISGFYNPEYGAMQDIARFLR